MANPAPKKPKAKATSKTKAKKAAAKAARTSTTGTTLIDRPRQPGVERRKNHPARASHGYMQLLLTHAVPHLGQPGELVKVRPGYARNFLLPQGFAMFATPHNLRLVDKHRARLKALEEAKRADLQSLAAQVAQRSIQIEANANAEGHLYGSVNAAQIAEALRKDGLQIDEEMVRIEGPLKELGRYTIKVAFGLDVETEFKLWVVPTYLEEAGQPAG